MPDIDTDFIYGSKNQTGLGPVKFEINDDKLLFGKPKNVLLTGIFTFGIIGRTCIVTKIKSWFLITGLGVLLLLTIFIYLRLALEIPSAFSSSHL